MDSTVLTALFNKTPIIWHLSIISGKNDVRSKCFFPSKMCFWSNQMSNCVFLIRNLITWCFLGHCNPITCNLWLPNALSHAYTHACAHSSLSGASVEVNCIPSISWSWCRASGSQRSLERLLENALQAPIRNEHCRLGDERKERRREKRVKRERWKMAEVMKQRGMVDRGVKRTENKGEEINVLSEVQEPQL